MGDIRVNLDLSGLVAFQRALDDVSAGKGQQMFADVLNRVGDATRTQFRRELVKQSGIAPGKINTQTRRAYPGNLRYQLIQDGGAVNVSAFRGRETTWGVAAAPWSRQQEYRGGFLVKKFSNFAFHRTGSSRLPIAPIHGPSLAREALRKGEGAFQAFNSAPSRLAPAILSALKRYFP